MFKIVNFCVNSFPSKPTFLKNNGGFLALPFVPSRTMTSKKFREKKTKPAPFPYKERAYNMFWAHIDKTYKRFDENTKLIIIEGPPASGKHKLAKLIADEFGMKYVPDVTMDYKYINHYGYDLRNLDAKMPESLQTFDENDFLRDPWHINCAGFQGSKYVLRWHKYYQQIEHLFNTGEGVVTVRSPFSDFVFSHAMRASKYISEGAKFHCSELARHTIHYLFRPHLVIYLDVSVDQTLENIKKRNRGPEVNGKALTREYLGHLEHFYKSIYLREASVHSLMLHYDWAEGGEPEVVVEDIERLDFEKYLDEDFSEDKLEDWRLEEWEADYERYEFCMERETRSNSFDTIMIFDPPEMMASGGDWEIFLKLHNNAPGNKYDHGYNMDQGDSVLFKQGYYWRPYF